MNGQGQLGPLTTPSFPQPIFHFHLHKQTHTSTERVLKAYSLSKKLHQRAYSTPVRNNAEHNVTFKPSTTAAAGKPVGF